MRNLGKLLATLALATTLGFVGQSILQAAPPETTEERLARAVAACQSNDFTAMREFTNPADAVLLGEFFSGSNLYQAANINYAAALYRVSVAFKILGGAENQRRAAAVLSLCSDAIRGVTGEIIGRHFERGHAEVGQPYPSDWKEEAAAELARVSADLSRRGKGEMRPLIAPLIETALHEVGGGNIIPGSFDLYVRVVIQIIDFLETDPFERSQLYPGIEVPDGISPQRSRRHLIGQLIEPLLISNHRHLAPAAFETFINLDIIDPGDLRDLVQARSRQSSSPLVQQLGLLLTATFDGIAELVELTRTAESEERTTTNHDFRGVVEKIKVGGFEFAAEHAQRGEALVEALQAARAPGLWSDTSSETWRERQQVIGVIIGPAERSRSDVLVKPLEEFPAVTSGPLVKTRPSFAVLDHRGRAFELSAITRVNRRTLRPEQGSVASLLIDLPGGGSRIASPLAVARFFDTLHPLEVAARRTVPVRATGK